MRQAIVRDERRNVRQFSGFCPQEFAARRHIVEEVPDGDDSAASERSLLGIATSCRLRSRSACRWSLRGSESRVAGERTEANRRQSLSAEASVAMESRSFTSRSLLVA